MIRKLLSTQLNTLVSADMAILILRVFTASFLLTHGIPKLLNVLSGNFKFADPIGLGPELSLILSSFAEGICAILILIGLGTRLAAIPLIINMSVAAFVAHAGSPFGIRERALLYLVTFIVLLFTGAGKYSLDQGLFNKRFTRQL